GAGAGSASERETSQDACGDDRKRADAGGSWRGALAHCRSMPLAVRRISYLGIMQANPFDGAIYVFRAKRADRLKLLFWDGTGVCLLAKRLEENDFCWPKIEDGVMRLTSAQLSAL